MLTYRACEVLTEVLIYATMLFGPWTFGATEPWSMWALNVMCYSLGLLWLTSKIGRCWIGFRPQNWSDGSQTLESDPGRKARNRTAQRVTTALATLTITILGYCLVSAINRRATYLSDEGRFEYHDCLRWLPHSFDSRSTWRAFWTYLGLACSFWSIRAWLLGKSSQEQLTGYSQRDRPSTQARPIPVRLKRLMWLLALNGAVLALEGIAQRQANSPRLLFLVLPNIHQSAESQFGPFAYRANAAEYFNLVWPVCLGFWWTLDNRETHRTKHHLLLGCATLMAACPAISTSRGGAIISLGLLAGFAILGLIILFGRSVAVRRYRIPSLVALSLFFLAAPTLAFSLGWKALQPRLSSLKEGFDGRERICRSVRNLTEEFPIFGTGPGTYEAVSELYRPNTPDFWPAQVHNDWLETRITFGLIGSALIFLIGGLVVTRWLLPGGLGGGEALAGSITLALGACLVHARFDFPFQVQSILSLFVVLSAVLFTLSRRPTQTV